MTPTPPATFTAVKNLVRIHLKQILKLDRITTKVPMHAVALLVVIAFEALGKLLHPRKGPEYLFAQEHAKRRKVPLVIGAAIFDALRNGLTHRYGPYPLVVEDLGLVRLQLTWKNGAAAHLRGISVRMVAGRQEFSPFPAGTTTTPQDLCLNVETLRQDLDAVFAQCEARLVADPALARRFERNVVRNFKEFTRTCEGNKAREWREFLLARRLDRPE